MCDFFGKRCNQHASGAAARQPELRVKPRSRSAIVVGESSQCITPGGGDAGAAISLKNSEISLRFLRDRASEICGSFVFGKFAVGGEMAQGALFVAVFV